MTDWVERNQNWQKRVNDRKESRQKDRIGKHKEFHKRAFSGAINDVTGDIITVGSEGDKYRDNYDRIFRKKD